MIYQKEFYGEKGSYSYLVTALGARGVLLIDPTPDCMDDYAIELEKIGRDRTFTVETGSVRSTRWAAREISRRWLTLSIVPCDLVEDPQLIRVGHGDSVNLGGIKLDVVGRIGRLNDAVSYHIDERVFIGDRRLHEEPELLALPPQTVAYRSICAQGENIRLLGRAHDVLVSGRGNSGAIGYSDSSQPDAVGLASH